MVGVPGLGSLPEKQSRRRLLEATRELVKEELKRAQRRGPLEDERLLTSKEIAPYLGIQHHKTVEKWAKTKGLPCIRQGRNLRFRVGDVRRWLAQREER